jgi:hypothetical protein
VVDGIQDGAAVAVRYFHDALTIRHMGFHQCLQPLGGADPRPRQLHHQLHSRCLRRMKHDLFHP